MVLVFWFDECFLVCFSSNEQILPSLEHQTKQSQRLQMWVKLREPLDRIESHYCILRAYFWFILINCSTLNPTLTAEHSLSGGGFPQPGCLWSERVKKVWQQMDDTATPPVFHLWSHEWLTAPQPPIHLQKLFLGTPEQPIKTRKPPSIRPQTAGQ